MYHQQIIWFKKSESFDFIELGKILTDYFFERCNGTVQVKQIGLKVITLKVDSWNYQLSLMDCIIGENRKFIESFSVMKPFTNELNHQFRIELLGDEDPKKNYIYYTHLLLDILSKEYDCIIYDLQAAQLYDSILV